MQPDLEDMHSAAKIAGLVDSLHVGLRELVLQYRDIFRNKMGSDPPANVPPMVIRLKTGTKPVRVKLRRYSPPQAAFLRNKVGELLQLGLIYQNTQSQWASAPLIVPKPGPELFRFTVDLRPVNAQTEPAIWPMPNIDSALSQISGATCFASLDFCHGYWQLSLDRASQECQSFICPDGVYSPTRVLHGQTNALAHY